MSNKSPAFQFYPDKWESHTKHLSDYAYRIMHMLLCWMWQHSPDKCSIEADNMAVATVLGQPLDKIKAAMDELRNPYMPLLKERRNRWVSDGIRKEAEKQRKRKKDASDAAKKRWGNRIDPMPSHSGGSANPSIPQCTPSPIPSPTPSPASKPKKEPSPEAINLARKLAQSILSWKPDYTLLQGPKETSTTLRWAKDIDSMLKLDRVSVERIELVLKALPLYEGSNGFTWRVNVLSGAKLREKFDKLEIAFNGSPSAPSGRDTRFDPIPENPPLPKRPLAPKSPKDTKGTP